MVTIDTLFASATDKKVVEDSAPTSPSAAAGTGISLLDTIFASASPNRNSTLFPNGSASQLSSPAPSSLKRQTSRSLIYSPQPSSSASPPQVLTQDVISGLLSGFPPTRTTSAASTTYSLGAVSHPSSREGDNEDNSEDMNPESDADHQRPSGSVVARIAGSDLLNTLGFSTSGRQDSRGRINGDVTPRAPLTRPGGSHRLQSTAIEATSSNSTVRGNSKPVDVTVSSTVSPPPPPPPLEANRKPRSNRTLVPFEPDSELWPYRAEPVQENPHCELDDDGDIVELSFEETSVLSDPEAFQKALQRKKSGLMGIEESVNGHRYVNGTSSSFSEKEKGRRNKKSKKERDAMARREIEESWDVPPPPSFVDSVTSNSRSFSMVPLGPPASPSPCASPELVNTSFGVTSPSGLEMKTPTMTAKATLGNAGKYINGTSAPAVTAFAPPAQAYTPAKAKGASNGILSPMKRAQNGSVDVECIRESIVTALEAQPKPVGRMERSEFIREVLGLIHVSCSRIINHSGFLVMVLMTFRHFC